MAGRRVPVGVVGVGSLGFHHARILGDLPSADLVGVHDIDPQRASRAVAELGVRALALDELLAAAAAVVIAVPTSLHAEVALAALERGVHVLIEKPIATSLAEADRILDSAAARGLLVATGHVERFNSALRACEPYLDSPRFVESHRLAPFGVRGTDVAVVLDLMIHDIDLVLSLVGGVVDEVAAVGVPVLSGSADIANARLTFASGSVANITASRVSVDRVRKIRLFQPSGYISLDLARGRGEFLRLRPGFAPPSGPEFDAASLAAIVERLPIEGDGAEPLRAELEAFLGAVRGAHPPVVSGDDGRRALAVALQIMERVETSLGGRSAA